MSRTKWGAAWIAVRRAAGCFALATLMATSVAAELDAPHARRIVSLNPSLTAILISIGARDSLVGVDDFSSRQQPEVKDLPLVGGLFSPSLEAVVALEPDLVVLVPSAEQRDFRSRLEALGIELAVFHNIRYEQVLENIERLGKLVGRQPQAAARIDAIEQTRAAVKRAVARRARPKTLVILQRSPIFVVGRGSFIDEMLTTVGADNLGATFEEAYPRVATEWLVAAAPEVLLDMSLDPEDAADFWSRWSTIPAVREGRVHRLEAAQVTLPGPQLDQALEMLASALHGDAILAEIASERRRLAAARSESTTTP